MKNCRLLVPVLGACCLALSLVPARAQEMHSMRQSFDTSGGLSWGGHNQDVRRVRVELDEDGDARLKFDTEGHDKNWGWRDGDWANWDQNLEIDGVWLRDNRGIIIDLRRGFGGQIVVGTARLNEGEGFVQSRPLSLTLNGRIVRRPWDSIDLMGNLDFGGWNGGGGTVNRLDELTTIKRGTGQFTNGNEDSNITRADVSLLRDGTARITLSGDRTWTFEGRWRQTGPDRVELRLDSFAAQSDRRIQGVPGQTPDSIGGGEIILDGTRIVSIRLGGSTGDLDFDAYFEPQVNTNNGGVVWGGGDNGNNGGWDGGGVIIGGGGGWPGGWHDRDHDHDGGWNGRPGNGGWGDKGNGTPPDPNPRTRPGNPNPDNPLHDQWKGWTGEGGNRGKDRGGKGTPPPPVPVTAPPPAQPPVVQTPPDNRNKGDKPAPPPAQPPHNGHPGGGSTEISDGPTRGGRPGFTRPPSDRPRNDTPAQPTRPVAPPPAVIQPPAAPVVTAPPAQPTKPEPPAAPPAQPTPPREERKNTQPPPPPTPPTPPREERKNTQPPPPPTAPTPREEPKNTQPTPPPTRREEPRNTPPTPPPAPREEPKNTQPASPPPAAPEKKDDNRDNGKSKDDDNERPRGRVGKPR